MDEVCQSDRKEAPMCKGQAFRGQPDLTVLGCLLKHEQSMLLSGARCLVALPFTGHLAWPGLSVLGTHLCFDCLCLDTSIQQVLIRVMHLA
jgi:hypothetical protein